MVEANEELLELSNSISSLIQGEDASLVRRQLPVLIDKGKEVGKAWSRSYLGYHANVYYQTLDDPPAGERFDPNWGFMDSYTQRGTSPGWKEFRSSDIRQEILRRAGEPDLVQIGKSSSLLRDAYQRYKSEVISIMQSSRLDNDKFLDSIKSKIIDMEPRTKSDISSTIAFPHTVTRDMTAVAQGARLPPHMDLIIEAQALLDPLSALEELEKQTRIGGSHILRVMRNRNKLDIVGTNLFIGHGQSGLWRELKDFVQDRLQLPWDEFNRVPIAGVTNLTRLSQMLDEAAFAFLVMTAEDERADGSLQARMNVIHEAGLFQGRLGFTKAIVLLEEGCKEFSNIQGLGQIRFPKGNIRSAFEDVRLVLEREGIIASSQ